MTLRIKYRSYAWLLVSVLLLTIASAGLAQTAPAWQPNTSYAVGALVTFNGVTYRCIQAHTSLVGWEPPNTPALWQPVSGGGGGGCSAVSSAPTGLNASSTTGSGTNLSWTAPAAPSGCTITSYTVFQNGSAIASTASTSFSVTGLLPSTTYNFTVAASDSAGMSAQSGALSVTTSSGTSGSGVTSRSTCSSWANRARRKNKTLTVIALC